MEFSSPGNLSPGWTPHDQQAYEDVMERMLQWFEYSHLPGHLQAVSLPFHHLAHDLCQQVDPGPERTVALRKLLEAKDAAVRATVHPGG